MRTNLVRPILTVGLAVALLTAAIAQQQTTPQQTTQQQPPPVIPGVAPASAPAQAAPQAIAPPATVPAQTAQPAPIPGQAANPSAVPQGFDAFIPNGSLTDFIDDVAKRVGFSYILDPAVGGKGSVSLITYGEQKPTDLMTLLQTVLRVNGATMVKVGQLYRIIPINKISAMPIEPMMNVDQKTLPEDERMLLDLIFLKYSTAKEIENLITPFLGEGASHSTYEPANLLILQDNARNMKRTLKLIELFDSEDFAGKRVQLFEIANSRPSDLVKDLDTVFKSYALAEKVSPVHFIPVDRINVLIAVAPNPGIFPKVADWIDKLDVAVKVQAGEVSTYVYRLKYARAATTAMAIMALYTGNINALIQLQMMQAQQNGIGNGNAGYGGMNYGNGMGGGGFGNFGGGNFGGGGYGNTGGGGYGNYAGGYGNSSYGNGGTPTGMIPPVNIPTPGNSIAGPVAGPNTPDLTGMALGAGGNGFGPGGQRIPHVIPNPFDNTLLIQGTPQDYNQILNLLRQLDVPPRQVLIEMKVYELDLSDGWQAGLSAYLEPKGTNATGLGRALNLGISSSGLGLSLGTLVGSTKELLGAFSASESKGHTKLLSAPTIIATDSIPASMNIGTDVPVLTSQAVVGGVQANGSNVFSNTVSSESTGMTLSITAHVSPSGVVTMIVDQDVSAPVATSTSSINSPSFSQREFQTQVTVQDGDTIAIGGGIQEQKTDSVTGVPFLIHIPIIGGLFGSRSVSVSRTELVVFITPKVLYDTNQLLDASQEIEDNLKHLKKTIKQDQ
jgi:general secretion pathway protein D